MTNRDGHPACTTRRLFAMTVITLVLFVVSCDALWTQRHHDARASSCADVHIGTEPLWCQATIDSVRTGVQVAIHHASLDDQAIVGMNHVMYYIYKRTSLVAAHIDAPPNQFLWRVDLSPVPFGSNPALDPIRGIIYVLQGGPIAMTLLAFDPGTLALQYAHGHYFHDIEYRLFRYGVDDGRYLWKQSVENVAAVSAPVVHPSGVVLIAVLNDAELSAIYAFNGPSTSFIGDLTLWNYTRVGAAAGVANAPAVGPLRWSTIPNPNDAANGTVYVLFSRDDDATLVALHPTTGELLWEVTFPDSHPADVPTIVRHDGTILVAGRVVTPDGHIVGDADSGLVIAVGAALPSLPAGPSFALLGLKQVIGRIDPPEDDHIWSFTAEGEILGATVDGSMVYVSAIYGALDQQGILYGLNMTDGQMLWRLAVPSNDAIVGSAVVASDGTLLWMAGQSIYRIGHCSGRGNCSSTVHDVDAHPFQPRRPHQPVCTCAADWYAANCSVACTQAQCAATMPAGAHTECGVDGTCACIDGWYPDGECTRQCDVNTCRRTHGNHAHCNDDGQCVCDGSYYTPTCGKRCLHGTIHANGTICKCAPNYFGDDEHTSCVVFCERVESCSNHGTCGSNGQCVCDASAFWSLSRYSGDECVDGLNMKPWLSIGLPMMSICLIICVLRALRRARRAARQQAAYDQQMSKDGGGEGDDDSVTNGRSLHSGGPNTASNSATDVLSTDLKASLLSSSTSSTGNTNNTSSSSSSTQRRAPPPLVVTTQPSLRSIPSLNSPRSGGHGPGPRGFALGSSPVVNRFASNNSNSGNTNSNINSNSTGNGNGGSRTIAVSMPRSPSGSEPIGSGMAALTPKKFQSSNPRQAMMNAGMVGSPASSSYIPPSSLSSNASSRSSVLRVTPSTGASNAAPSSPSHARAIASRNNNNNTATRNNNGAIAGLPAPLLLSPPSSIMPGSMSIPSHMIDSSAYSPSSHDDSPLMSPHAPPSAAAVTSSSPSSSVVRSPTLPTGWKA